MLKLKFTLATKVLLKLKLKSNILKLKLNGCAKPNNSPSGYKIVLRRMRLPETKKRRTIEMTWFGTQARQKLKRGCPELTSIDLFGVSLPTHN